MDILQMNKKERKNAFLNYLIDVYRPAVLNANRIFEYYKNVDNFCKNHHLHYSSMFEMSSVDEVQSLIQEIRNPSSKIAFARKPIEDMKIVLLEKYIAFITSISEGIDNESEKEIERALEGQITETKLWRRKRNRELRNQCAENAHYTCYVCGTNFEVLYGSRGKNYIEVHHTKPMASYPDEHEVKLEELCALCANCHRMVHRKKEVMDVDELKEFYQKRKNSRLPN